MPRFGACIPFRSSAIIDVRVDRSLIGRARQVFVREQPVPASGRPLAVEPHREVVSVGIALMVSGLMRASAPNVRLWVKKRLSLQGISIEIVEAVKQPRIVD